MKRIQPSKTQQSQNIFKSNVTFKNIKGIAISNALKYDIILYFKSNYFSQLILIKIFLIGITRNIGYSYFAIHFVFQTRETLNAAT